MTQVDSRRLQLNDAPECSICPRIARGLNSSAVGACGRLDYVNKMEDYGGRVQAIVWEAAEWLPTHALDQAQRLADAGENGDAMIYVAWGIVREQVQVPREFISRIRSHAAGLVDESKMPSNLDMYGV
jgi:hypothetical protein